MMLVRQAREAARQWVIEEAGKTPGFVGAFFHGSIHALDDADVLPATSDVDVMVVVTGSVPPVKMGKFLYRDVLLEVSYLPDAQAASPEDILSQYHLAGSFRAPGIILDPSGRLTRLQEAVSRDFARRRWVVRRCEHARDKILHGFTLDESAPFHDQVNSWLFPAAVTTHVLLVAGLKNPTVRRRYAAARELLAEYNRSDFHETLLELLGCAAMSRGRVGYHLAALADAFDAAKTRNRTPFFFASDLSDAARPIAIEGSREMIARGLHREAIFWMAATYSRCQQVLFHDAPVEMQERFSLGFRELFGDLGIASLADLQRRKKQVEEHVPRVWEVAEAIVAANPEIEEEA